ncbi:hypothetical protein KIW84_070212, partial [Lathyrus oleraceus]
KISISFFLLQLTMSSSSVTQTKTEQQHRMKSRKPRNQIKNHHKPISQMDQQTQTTRCNSTISSLLLSTFSNETAVSQQPTTSKKINFLSAAATFRGLGCTAGASQQVSVPAVIRASADWTHQGKKTRKKKHKGNTAGGSSKNSSNEGSSSTCVDFQDVWCGPGIDAAASVDCVVSKKNVSSRAKIDLEKITHREPSSSFRRRTTVYPDTDPDIFTACSFGTATYPRHIRDLSSDDLSEIMLLQGRILMGGRYNSRDLFRDLRLDVDNMSYEVRSFSNNQFYYFLSFMFL